MFSVGTGAPWIYTHINVLACDWILSEAPVYNITKFHAQKWNANLIFQTCALFYNLSKKVVDSSLLPVFGRLKINVFF